MTINFSTAGAHVRSPSHQNLLWINIQSLTNPLILCVPCAARNFSKCTKWKAIKVSMTWTRNSGVCIQDTIMCTKARVSTIVIIDPTVGNMKNMTFTEKQNLDQHMELHSNNFKEVCKTCGKRFCWRSSLRVHIWVKHSSSTPSTPPRPPSPE